ncbi:MAG: peptidylprolyl isomerase [Clostridia bacterium]|nr:peptidylprolyl isomerase [Clostridia bacterium]
MKKGIRILALLLSVLALMSFVSCSKEGGGEDFTSADGVTYTASEEKTNFVCIQMDTGKKIVVELYPDTAPITVENFQKLVGMKFYDGLIFHRVIPGFMIQGGCPDGTGGGDPGWEIKGEFAANGVENNLSHARGVLSMARSNDPDSAGSQFFICHSTAGCAHLDGQYATFGKVVSGMDVVDEIATTKCAGETPLEKQVMEKVYFVSPESK